MNNQYCPEILMHIVRSDTAKLLEFYFYVVIIYLIIDQFYYEVSASFYSPFFLRPFVRCNKFPGEKGQEMYTPTAKFIYLVNISFIMGYLKLKSCFWIQTSDM